MVHYVGCQRRVAADRGLGPSRAVSLILLLSALLMAAGSLRNLISPAGYWGAWGVWLLLALAVAWPRGPLDPAWRRPRWVMGSYGVLCLAMLLAAAVNRDAATAYQALKIAVIALMFLAMWGLARHADWRQLVRAAAGAVIVMLLSLAISKYWTVSGGLRLYIGNREGSVLASYGVLWKAGALFLPLFLADLAVRSGAWRTSGPLAAACLFITLADGSRTGQLVLVMIGVGFLAYLLRRGGWSLLNRSLRWLWLIPVLLFVFLLFNSWLHGGPGDPARILDAAWTRMFETRLGAGDPARMKLLQAAFAQIPQCQPFGCGFMTTGADIHNRGTLMPVHNAYLAALGDFGVLGLAGMLGFLVAAILPIWRAWRGDVDLEQGFFVVATAGSALAYGVALMLNTFTTEMSEWGYLILMLAFAWAPPKTSA